MSNRVKMIVGGVCNLIVLVTFALILVVLSENQVVHHVLAATSGSISELNSNRVVLTTQDAGSFVGKKEPLAQDDPNEVQQTFFSFRGISYALAKRWQPPEPIDLKSIHQATDFKPPCSQWSPIKRKTIGVPDCLYLNVFTPYIPMSSKRPIGGNISSWTVETPHLLPVLVYVHGGEFISGSGTQYSPDQFIKRERVVVCTFNYRLGVLGFLSSGNEELPGNYGLMDQIAALKWIQKYIHRFGGNPLRITIVGSVEYLLLANLADSNENSNLFHAAILTPQSTSVLNPFAKFNSKEGASNFLKQLAESVGCTKTDYTYNDNATSYASLIECLRMADTDSLIRSQTKLLTFHNLPFSQIKANPLGPVVDKILLDDEPEVLFSSGKFHDVPIMVGLSANEGYNPFLEFYLKLYRKNANEIKKDEIPEEKCNLTQILAEEDVKNLLRSIVQTVMAAVPDMDKNGAFERVFQSIWNYYFGGISSKIWNAEIEQVVQKLFRLFGDMLVNTGHCTLLQSLSNNSKAPIYSYVFSHGINKFAEYFKYSRNIFENSEAMMAPKRPKRSLHMNVDAPWEESYYLFYPVGDLENISLSPHPANNNKPDEIERNKMSDEDIKITEALVKFWVSFSKYHHPKQATQELPDYGKWIRMESGHRSNNYYLISNLPLQNGMRSDFRKAECQFWMSTVPQVRKLSKVIQDLEPFPILFWSSVAVVILFALIIITLIVLIVCVKQRTGSYGGEGIYLHHARHL